VSSELDHVWFARKKRESRERRKRRRNNNDLADDR
jgi:hypothetical protein